MVPDDQKRKRVPGSILYPTFIILGLLVLVRVFDSRLPVPVALGLYLLLTICAIGFAIRAVRWNRRHRGEF